MRARGAAGSGGKEDKGLRESSSKKECFSMRSMGLAKHFKEILVKFQKADEEREVREIISKLKKDKRQDKNKE